MSWRKYLYIYETDIVAPGLKFNLGNVKIETFAEERTFAIATNIQTVILEGKGGTLLQSNDLYTSPDHTTLLLTARTKETNIFDARKRCVEELDSIVALLGSIYHPTVFDKKLYAGWDYADPVPLFAESAVYFTDKVHQIEPVRVAEVYETIGDKELYFRKMSKMYAQSVSMPISEEKFVKLWTILEIYPLETTPDQRLELDRLYDLLKRVTGLSKNQINKKLKIHSEIYDKFRSEIVHTGSIGFSEIELKNTTAKLDAIVRVVMRDMLGLSYEDELADFI